MIRQYISFLLSKDQPAAVADLAPALVRAGDSNADLGLLLGVVNRLVVAGDAGAASRLWRLLIDQHWVSADSTVPNNANFQREPVPVSFDWSFPEYEGLHSWPGTSGLDTEITGNEPEDCVIAEQAIVLTPGKYTLSYTYRTSGIPPATGIKWQILDANSNAVVAESNDLSSDEEAHSALTFSVQPGNSLLRLRLAYKRSLGTVRIAGMLNVQSAQIKFLPKA